MSELQHNELGCVRGWKDGLTQLSLQDDVFGGGGGGMERGAIKAAVMEAYRESHRVAANNQSVMKGVLGNRKEERKADDDEDLFSVGDPRSILSEADSDEFVTRSESPMSALKRISKAIRALSETTKALKVENEQFRMSHDCLTDSFEMNSRSRITDSEMDEFLEELEHERIEHERTRNSLERKDLETQKQAARLEYIEGVTDAIYKENLELIRTIQELQAHGESGARRSESTIEAMKAELSRVKEALKYNAHKMDDIDQKATKTACELQRYKEETPGILFKTWMWTVWCLARIVNFAVLAFFVYLAVSVRALRSRGVDPYRYAH